MKIDRTVGDVHITFSDARLTRNVKSAQTALNKQIVADCTPLIPFQQGALRGSVRFPDGVDGGQIEWDAPYAHYQYVGQVWGPNIPQYDEAGNLIGWRSPRQKYPTDRRLQYHTAGTGSEWFEEAKKKRLNVWVSVVNKKMQEE